MSVPYDNPWIQVRHNEVLDPSGAPGIYGVVHFKHLAIGIIPIDEEGHIWLVGQYRFPLGEYSWEIVEGGGPLADDPLDSAKRELLEETGLRASEWELLVPRLHLSNSVSDEAAMIYVARGLTQGKAQPTSTEDLQLKRLPLQEAVAMAKRGEITDAISVAGLLMLG